MRLQLDGLWMSRGEGYCCPQGVHGLEDGWGNEATSLLCWGLGRRWEELHTLASEPREQHVLMAEQVEDATNGFFSTLSSSAICTIASPGKSFQAGRVASPMWKWCMGWGGFLQGKRPEPRSLPREGR